MAGASRTLKLSILADVDKLNKSLNSANNDVESSSKKIGAFGKKAGLAFAAAGIAAAVFAVKFAKDAIVAGEAASTANARIGQINESMGLFGESVGVVSDRLVDYAEKTARLTGVDTNSIKATQAKLLTFKEIAISADEIGGAFDRATMAAIDLAAAGFGTAEGNAVQLGKALNDPIKGLASLAKSGVTFTEVEKDRIKTLVESNKISEAQQLILAAIESQVGGTAEATSNATDRMKIGFQQLTERVGLKLLPVLEAVTNFILDYLLPAFETYLLPIVEKFTDAISSSSTNGLGKRISETVETIKTFAMPIFNGLVTVFDKVKDAITGNSESFESFFKVVKYLAPFVGSIIGGALSAIGSVASVVVTVFAKVLGAIEPVLNFAIKSINAIIRGLNIISPFEDIKQIPEMKKGTKVTDLGMIPGTETVAIPKIPTVVVPKIPTAGLSTAAASGAKAAESTSKPKPTFASPFAGQVLPGMSVTVNQGIVGDPEGAARAVVDVINNSFYRGTGGADGFAFA